uniref:Uncharacterized protein n=1 Tax=Heterosigma akashiwo TaxID=2829 RepID=A0A7S3UWD2_HETAK
MMMRKKFAGPPLSCIFLVERDDSFMSVFLRTTNAMTCSNSHQPLSKKHEIPPYKRFPPPSRSCPLPPSPCPYPGTIARPGLEAPPSTCAGRCPPPCGHHVHVLPPPAGVLRKVDPPGRQRKERVVPPKAHVPPGVELRATLADDDAASLHRLPAKYFNP